MGQLHQKEDGGNSGHRLSEKRSMPKRIIIELIATPSRCFLWAVILIMFAAGLASPFIVVREKQDAAGRTVFDSDGTPVLEIDQWADFAAHWSENLCFLGGLGFGVLGFAIWIFRLKKKRGPHFG